MPGCHLEPEHDTTRRKIKSPNHFSGNKIATFRLLKDMIYFPLLVFKGINFTTGHSFSLFHQGAT